MTPSLEIVRVSPLSTIQDNGRPGTLRYGISASGPMDRAAFVCARTRLETAGEAGIEFTMAGLGFVVKGSPVRLALAGGVFNLKINDKTMAYPGIFDLLPEDEVDIFPGVSGNYGYACFDHEIEVPKILGSRATNLIAGLGGFEGRALETGDVIQLMPANSAISLVDPGVTRDVDDGVMRFIWGLHAEQFTPAVRARFIEANFNISSKFNRMGMRLDDIEEVFKVSNLLSLVSDSIVPGDIQILGDGTPIVLMRDHQPTGGYPRIGTIISADLDRLAQMRPRSSVRFEPVTAETAQHLMLAKPRLNSP